MSENPFSSGVEVPEKGEDSVDKPGGPAPEIYQEAQSNVSERTSRETGNRAPSEPKRVEPVQRKRPLFHPISKGGKIMWKNHDDLVYKPGQDTGPRPEPPKVDPDAGPRYSSVMPG